MLYVHCSKATPKCYKYSAVLCYVCLSSSLTFCILCLLLLMKQGCRESHPPGFEVTPHRTFYWLSIHPLRHWKKREKVEQCNRLKKINPVLSPRGEVFHFIFHYLSGASINARRIREITWALAFPWPSAYPPLCSSLSLSVSVFFFIIAPLPPSPCSLCLHTIFPTLMYFPLSFACLYQSLNVIATLLPFHLVPMWHTPFSISPTPIFVF